GRRVPPAPRRAGAARLPRRAARARRGRDRAGAPMTARVDRFWGPVQCSGASRPARFRCPQTPSATTSASALGLLAVVLVGTPVAAHDRTTSYSTWEMRGREGARDGPARGSRCLALPLGHGARRRAPARRLPDAAPPP